MDNGFLLLNIASVLVGITIFLSHLVTNNKSRQDKYFGVLMLLCIVACLLDIHWMYIECFGFSDSTRWISTIILNMSMFPVTIGSYIVVRYFECLAVKQTRLVNLTIRILQINLLVVLALTLALTLSGQVLDCSGDTLGYLQGYSMITLVNNVAAVLQVLSTVIILSGVEHKNYLPLILFLLITMGAAACSVTGYEYCVFPIITYAGVVFYICIQISKINMSTVESVRDALASAEEKNKLLEESYERLESEQRVLDTIAGIYNTMHVINLKNYDTCELSANSRIHNILTANEDRAMQERMWETMMKVVSEQHRERLFDFTNFSTIENRMEGKKLFPAMHLAIQASGGDLSLSEWER